MMYDMNYDIVQKVECRKYCSIEMAMMRWIFTEQIQQLFIHQIMNYLRNYFYLAIYLHV